MFDGFDVVIHAAAHLPMSYADPAEAQRCMDINALGTLAVLEECVRAGVRKVVYLSTNLYRLSAAPVREDAAFEPSAQASYYLVSKASADFFAGHFANKLPVATLRLGSVYGRGLMRGVISTFTTQLFAGTPISVDDGNYQADFVDVHDVAAAVVAAVERDVRGPLNVGSGRATRPFEIARLLVELTGAPAELVQVRPGATELRGFSALDIGRARTELGLAPRALIAGLRDYVDWRRAGR